MHNEWLVATVVMSLACITACLSRYTVVFDTVCAGNGVDLLVGQMLRRENCVGNSERRVSVA